MPKSAPIKRKLTKAQIAEKASRGLRRALQACARDPGDPKMWGAQVELAKRLTKKGMKITGEAINQWKRVPVARVLVVEEVSGVPRHELAPDFYPEPAPASE